MTFEVRTFEARTASWWYRNRDSIEFNPDYQRKGPAWDTYRKAFLIDTIINDFDMPKLYLADFTYFNSPMNSTNKRFAIIDGKQRLTAIFEYFDDKFPLLPDITFRENPDLPLGGLRFSELSSVSPDLISKLENFNLPVMSVISDDTQAVNELFVRLNSGKPLTAAERRNVMNGVVPELVREITSSQFFTSCVAFKNAGRSHDQAAAKLLLIEHSERAIDLKKRQLENLYKAGVSEDDIQSLQSDSTTVLETLAQMSETFEEKDPILRTQGQIPVYYYLFRNLGDVRIPRESIRDFNEIRLFVRNPESSRVQLKDNPSSWEYGTAVEYNALARNPNDAQAVPRMAALLAAYIDQWLSVPRH
ncbi:DUF262 domain-containing protein [Rhodococcus sp. IEGM 1318]|uniref:DUF262 domain-containing protein n=1 Tax=Rhodococcus sp. IEGM 1318 TaxID=3082226 RepID=UPI002954E35F|nr:DUF262 domain-containing protein [Rhodococcus sp. IEGM 1318]MDV8008963.1 DUF262 domain-containing protein [Rhodococcus sp. IEGM 1318]